VTSGDVGGIVGTVPEALRASVWQIGNAAFANGFAAAALLAAAVAAAMALFTVLLVRRAETLPVTRAEGELIMPTCICSLAEGSVNDRQKAAI